MRNAGFLSVLLVALASAGLLWSYTQLFAEVGWSNLPPEERNHVLLNIAATCWIAIVAWRGRGQLDQKLSQAANATFIVYGLFFLLILGGRWFFSRPLLLTSFSTSIVVGFAITLLRHRLSTPRVGIVGPLSQGLHHQNLGEIIVSPTANLRDFDILLVSFPGEVDADWAQALSAAMLSGCKVRHIGEYLEESRGAVSLEHFELDHLSNRGTASYRAVKRAIDIGLVIFTLPLTIPIIVLAALGIFLTMGRPVFFLQDRIGLGGNIFRMWKLRTMRAAAPGEVARATSPRDPRITRLGAILRRFRIDELPQLWNVLKGDMTLIGPRPEAVAFHDEYVEAVPAWAYRTLLRPGITGWAQVCTGPSANSEEASRKLAYDLYYVKNCSWVLDLKIAAKTFWTITSGSGVR